MPAIPVASRGKEGGQEEDSKAPQKSCAAAKEKIHEGKAKVQLPTRQTKAAKGIRT